MPIRKSDCDNKGYWGFDFKRSLFLDSACDESLDNLLEAPKSQDDSIISTHQVNSSDAGMLPSAILDRCYKGRFQGYWDFTFNRMRFDDPVCDESLITLVKVPKKKDASVKRGELYKKHTNPALFDRLEGSCILMMGDSTDRQVYEKWCPRWATKGENSEIWMPEKGAERLNKQQLRYVGLRCNVRNSFTFGQYAHYGVSAPPYWKIAHMYDRKGPQDLDWGNTTVERVKRDVPTFFQRCDEDGHDVFKVVILQSYLWDLAREHLYGNTTRPTPQFMSEWATNVTTMVSWVRDAVPDAVIAWRFAGDLIAGKGRDSQAMSDMNAAIIALGDKMQIDFFTDYGAVLGSELAVKNGKPFNTHPPDEPQTGYANLMLNALVAAYDAKVNS